MCGPCGEPDCEGAFGDSCREPRTEATVEPSTPRLSSAAEAGAESLEGAGVRGEARGEEASSAPRACACAPGLHQITSCSAELLGGLTGGHGDSPVCHECELAQCAAIDGTLDPSLDGVLQRQLAAAHQPASEHPVRVFNPSPVSHGGRTLLIARITNQSRCDGVSNREWRPGIRWVSHIGICEYGQEYGPPAAAERGERGRTDGRTDGEGQAYHTARTARSWPVPRDCRTLPLNLSSVLEGSGYTHDADGAFVGLEDPRGFSLDGVMHITGAALLRRSSRPVLPVVRMVMFRLDRGLTRATSATVLFTAGPSSSSSSCVDSSRVSEKNWVFLRAVSGAGIHSAHTPP